MMAMIEATHHNQPDCGMIDGGSVMAAAAEEGGMEKER